MTGSYFSNRTAKTIEKKIKNQETKKRGKEKSKRHHGQILRLLQETDKHSQISDGVSNSYTRNPHPHRHNNNDDTALDITADSDDNNYHDMDRRQMGRS